MAFSTDADLMGIIPDILSFGIDSFSADHAKAQADIERETASAKDGLRSQVSSLAAMGASRILGKEVDDKTHAKLLDDLISQL